MLILFEEGHLPVYYFPLEDVDAQYLEPSDTHTTCPRKGEASYSTIRVGDRVAEDAAWRYPEPIDDCPDISGHVAFYWSKMDSWWEEDDEVFKHARDPYHRVDALRSSRHVTVEIDGEVVAETGPPAARGRDRPAAALVHPARRRPHRPPDAHRHEEHVPVQGRRELLHR